MEKIKIKLKYNIDFGVTTIKNQVKIFNEFKYKKKDLPENFERQVENYLFIKTLQKNQTEKILKQIKSDISSSYNILKELRKNG